MVVGASFRLLAPLVSLKDAIADGCADDTVEDVEEDGSSDHGQDDAIQGHHFSPAFSGQFVVAASAAVVVEVEN